MEAAEYAWLEGKDCIYTGMYSPAGPSFLEKRGRPVVQETTGYPYDGEIVFQVENHTPEIPVQLCDPAWCRNAFVNRMEKETDHTDGAGVFMPWICPEKKRWKFG